jgi:putative ABC transport system permease protein
MTRSQEDFEDEVKSHLELEAERLRRQGVADAELAARRNFGNVGISHERFHEGQPLSWLHDAGKDARLAIRMLLRSPGFAFVAILTIGLGIGATTAIFSVVDAVLFRPLPWAQAEQVVVPQSMRLGTGDMMSVTYRDFLLWQKDSVFEHVALQQEAELDITHAPGSGQAGDATGGDAPERVTIIFHTQDYFKALGVKPLLGRFAQPDEFVPNSNRPLVISYGLWQRRFGGLPSAVGSQIRMTGVPVTIVGVLPKGAEWPRNADAWYPTRGNPDPNMAPDNMMFRGMARLRGDRTLEQTRAQLATLAKNVAAEFPAKRRDVTVTATPFREYAVDATTRRALWTLLGAVAMVLLIACVNVANLLLVRASGRERELSLRAALGSSRWRMLRQFLIESLVLATIGGLLGIAIAVGLSRALVAMAPGDALLGVEVTLSWATLAVAAGCTLFAAIGFGLWPALRASRANPGQALGAGSVRTVGGRAQRRAAATLVVAEVALSLTLLTGAGLLVKSLLRLRQVDTGLDVRRAMTFQVALPQSRFDTPIKVAVFWDEYLRRLRALPGVTAASVTTALPLNGGGFYLGRTMIEAGAPEPPAGSETSIMWNEVGTQYFEAVGQPILAGRAFEERDDTTGTPKIIVTKAFADAMFSGVPLGSVVGKRVFSWRDERVVREIVGIAGDVRYESAADQLRPVVYVPQRENPRLSEGVIVRASGNPSDIAAAARRELASLDAGIAMADLQSMEETLARTMAPQRLNAGLFGAFAVLALVLAAIGLYGVLAYGVARETREIGVRMALGASQKGVMRGVLARSLTIAGIGAVIGLAGSFVATRALGSLLFDVQPHDVGTFASVTALLLVVAALASWVPARRATRVDPATALRAD